MRKSFLSILALLCFAISGAWADEYHATVCINDGSITVPDGEHWLVTGNGKTTSNQIYLVGTSTVTLSNVNISNNDWCMLCNGTNTVILKDGTTNTITCTDTGDNISYPAIWIGDSGNLTIRGGESNTGSLNVTGGYRGVAIGGGAFNANHSCGNINIEGGIVTATGGEGATAIGCDISGGSCGVISIADGVKSLTAIKGEGAADCIGKGPGSCMAVYINGTLYWYGIFDNSYKNGGEEYLQADIFHFANINNGSTEVPATSRAIIKGTGETSNQITIGDGAKVTFVNVNISNPKFCAKCEGTATIEVKAGTTSSLVSTGTSGDTYPALVAGGQGTTLTIQGTGTLDVQGGTSCAAIGAAGDNSCGNITIDDLSCLIATRGEGAAHCIGISGNGACGEVTVYGDKYWNGTAYQNNGETYLNQDKCTFANINRGPVTISNGRGLIVGTGVPTNNQITLEGTTTVTLNGVDITNDSWCMLCNANATVILADGKDNRLFCTGASPALWVGNRDNGSKLTIQDETAGTGSLSAIGGTYCPGIGGAISGNYVCGDIEIQGGTIIAMGGSGGAAIGSASSNACGNITITGDVTRVCAMKGTGSDCIGRGGNSSSCGTVTINGVVYWDGSSYQNNGQDYLAQEKFNFANICNYTSPMEVPENQCWILTSNGETTSKHIDIGEGATVVLDGVTISSSEYAIKCEGYAAIILKDGSENNLTAHNEEAGIQIGNHGKVLTIRGEAANTGILNVWGADGSVAIGGGRGNYDANFESYCGSITIDGGIINAYGGKDCSAIGLDCVGDIGMISITKGVRSLTAVKGEGAIDCIGKGSGSNCDMVAIGDIPYWYGAIPGYEKGYRYGGEEFLKADTFFFANINKGSVTVPASARAIISGTGETENQVTVGEGAKVMLSGVNINSLTSYGIGCDGNATIVLRDGSTNTLQGAPALKVGGKNNQGDFDQGTAKTLVIQCQEGGTGVLNAYGRNSSAGIGGAFDERGYACGNIVIEGGTINATGEGGAAAIGAAAMESCGSITITGGTVTATGGNGGAGIGAGKAGDYDSSCGYITINGGNINATGGNNAAGIGSGQDDTNTKSICAGITITDGVSSLIAKRGEGAHHCIGRGYDVSTCGMVTIDESDYWDGTDYLNGGEPYLNQNQFVFGHTNNASVTVHDGEHYFLVGNGEPTSNKIILEGTSSLTLSNVNISNRDWSVLCNGNSTIILRDGTENTIVSTGTGKREDTFPAIWVGDMGKGYKLTIQGETLGTGKLIAQGGELNPAIGGGFQNKNWSCGQIYIKGGSVIATGGRNAAAIGASYDGSCGEITITDDVTCVTAIRGNGADQCIGLSGNSVCYQVIIDGIEFWDKVSYQNNGEAYLNQDTFTIGNINNGPVTVPGGRGLIKGTGETTGNQITAEGTALVTLDNVNISNDAWGMACNGDITALLADGITNTFTSTGTGEAGTTYPAIWVGDKAEGHKFTVQAEAAGTGVLIAQGGRWCAGIGGGSHNENTTCGDIEIQGGTVTVTGGEGAPGIGSDYNGKCGDITITGGVMSLTAQKGAGANDCIGSANSENACASVTIDSTLYWNGSEYVNDGNKYLPLNRLSFANINNGAVTVPAGENALIVGTGEATENQITIGEGATVALSGVNICNNDIDKNYCVKCEGNATVDLPVGKTNSLVTNVPFSNALWAGNDNTTLTIQGSGELIAQSGKYSAGIGGGWNNNRIRCCGNINIEGGIITAVGGAFSVAIGSDESASCGSITISGNVGRVTAIKGSGAVDCIGVSNGGQNGWHCSGVTIDGVVYRSFEEYKNDGQKYLTSNGFVLANINDAGDAVTIPSGGCGIVKGTGEATENNIIIEDDGTVTLKGVNISSEASCIRCEGDATVVLADKTMNTLSSEYSTYPALWAGDDGTTLTIQGKGALKAQGGMGCPAIGGGYSDTNPTCGNIVIEGGIIDATGGQNATAIGSFTTGSCAGITITDGVTHLVAKGGNGATDCIGNSSSSSSCDSVTINGIVYWDGVDYKNTGNSLLKRDALAYLKAIEGNTGEYWTTFYYGASHFLAPEGTEVFKASIDGDSLSLSCISDRIADSGQGVILRSNAPYFFLTSCDEATASESGYEGNSLTGTAATITNPGDAYTLDKKSAGIGFYRLSNTETIPAGKAYLTYSGTSAKDFYDLDLYDADSLEGVKSDDSAGDKGWYSLDGKKLSDKPTQRGMYIHDGIKLIIK